MVRWGQFLHHGYLLSVLSDIFAQLFHYNAHKEFFQAIYDILYDYTAVFHFCTFSHIPGIGILVDFLLIFLTILETQQLRDL